MVVRAATMDTARHDPDGRVDVGGNICFAPEAGALRHQASFYPKPMGPSLTVRAGGPPTSLASFEKWPPEQPTRFVSGLRGPEVGVCRCSLQGLGHLKTFTRWANIKFCSFQEKSVRDPRGRSDGIVLI
jgi:hypothetical protein